MRQRRHVRRSCKGKLFKAGNRKAQAKALPSGVKKEVVSEYLAELKSQLKSTKRVRIPDIGILRVKTKRAVKGGKKIQMFGKTVITKSKPSKRVVKFRPASSLKGLVN